MSQLSPEAQALLREAQRQKQPASEAQSRHVLDAVRAAVVVSVPIASATAASSAADRPGPAAVLLSDWCTA